MLFNDKVILVTGAGSGIGRAAAMHFAKESGWVFGADRNETGLDETAGMMSASGYRFDRLKVDVSDEAAVAELVRTIYDKAGRLDAAFNNAGIAGGNHWLEDYPSDLFAQVISINLFSIFLCMKYQIPLIRRNGGAICNTASVAALTGPGGLSAYAASKCGVHGLTRVAAMENASKGVRVNALAPGLTDTPMVAATRVENVAFDNMARTAVPMKRAAQPDEAAAAAVWLCSPAASYVTGQMIIVDGGLTIGGFEP
ncbi:3-oxoacyl-(acyl-carrier-protein) reductase [Sphingobium chlorophenolicum L-1]|uniref:3-oxoacyl-(Acyl-carrier-protein) reductase n=1 Tax=Sphingobium chlorophenolicum L-1 TaxID=690566 RepID=F6EZ91_SPHCR|nr:SDR family NAD(P)-dependent oxidoreductase [Sphingobium chlorophenolicum]AEG50184.1 3-oxoacyl-(acyl-carrier-protein) reductase [Sphingobium chlorophenolicum L-1]